MCIKGISSAPDRACVRQPSHLVAKGISFPDVSGDIRADVSTLADEIRQADRRIGDTSFFGPDAQIGFGNGPAILLGDTGEIPLMIESGGHHLDYRLGWLARSGDLVVIGGLVSPAFEAYQKRILGEGGIDYLHVPEAGNGLRKPTPVICLRNQNVYRQLLNKVRQGGGATLVAHITTGSIWALATRLGRDTNLPIHVAGPPAVLSRRVNNKLWFGSVCTRLLGADTTPPKREAWSVSALTRHVAELACRWDRLVVKVPDSAGSAGNVVLDSKIIRQLCPVDLYHKIRRDLSVRGLRYPPFQVAVEAWDVNALTSPSVQIWIPGASNAAPVIEGIYEQVLEGDDHAFAGALQAKLPDRIGQVLSSGAMQLALLFQELGYYGRCSFDAIVSGGNPDNAKVHWIECNGRWGGVSIPMTLVNRLSPPGLRPFHAIIHKSGLSFRPRHFNAVLEEFADLAPASDRKSGVLFLSPNLIEDGAGCNFLSLGKTRQAAISQSELVVERLLS